MSRQELGIPDLRHLTKAEVERLYDKPRTRQWSVSPRLGLSIPGFGSS
jgi:hypothetical protein